MMNQFTQAKLPFTAFEPHTISPMNPRFAIQLETFAGICRVVRGMQSIHVGAIGARTTPWKTVRVDEIALEGMGITVETMDLSEVFARVQKLSTGSEEYRRKYERYRTYANWNHTPDENFENIVKTAMVLDGLIAEYDLNCLGLRCWNEFEAYLKICPCIILSELNERGIPASCEVDVANAISMYALQLASQQPAATLDWNNNYGDEEDKCIVFHC